MYTFSLTSIVFKYINEIINIIKNSQIQYQKLSNSNSKNNIHPIIKTSFTFLQSKQLLKH